jgi:tetratricopeptide (TPR) repeat protein
MARLDRLGRAKSLAQIAAVIGRDVPLAWLSRIASSDPETLRPLLDKIVAAGLIQERPGPDPTYFFAHALVHDAAYDSLLKSTRAEIHQRVAEMLASHHPELASAQPLLLAHHYGAAGMPSDALTYLRHAGHRALATSAFVEAIEVFNRALSSIPLVPSSRERDGVEIELLSALGLALLSTRGYSSSEVEDVYARARQLCERYGEAPLRVLFGVWGVHFVRADARGTKRIAALFERILTTTTDADSLLVARAALGCLAFYRMKFADARAHLNAACALIDRKAPRDQHNRLLASYGFEGLLSGPFWLAWVSTMQGHEDEARALLQDATALAEEIGDPYVICQVASHAAALHREFHDVAGTRQFAAQALALSTEHEFYFWRALALCAQGWATLQDGRPTEAIGMIREGLGTLDLVGSVINRSYFASYLVDAYLRTRQFDEGLRAVDDALVISRESLGPMYESELLRLKGVLLVELGQHEEALEYLRAALADARRWGARLLEVRAASSLSSLLGANGQVREAADVLRVTCRKWSELREGPELRAAREALNTLEKSLAGPATSFADG